jgi:NAD-dependent DNA ligase
MEVEPLHESYEYTNETRTGPRALARESRTAFLNFGIIINYPVDKNNNKIIVITGKFMNLSRDQIIEDITKLGYRVSNTVSKKTKFLICGEKPGNKQKKAKGLGIQIIYENELIKLLSKAR